MVKLGELAENIRLGSSPWVFLGYFDLTASIKFNSIKNIQIFSHQIPKITIFIYFLWGEGLWFNYLGNRIFLIIEKYNLPPHQKKVN